MSKILIISQGSRATAHYEGRGMYTPDAESFEAFMRSAVNPQGIEYDFVSIDDDVEGFESCHPKHCNDLAELIENRYGDYDGFMVLRGAQYADYVGASLAFSLQGNHKPILIGCAEGSFSNPVTGISSFMARGLMYLSTEGQKPEKRSDISILTGDIIVKAVDATLFPDGTGRYYSRTDQAFPVEKLLYVGDPQDIPHRIGGLQRQPIDEALNVIVQEGFGDYSEQWKFISEMPLDGVVLKTNTHGQFHMPEHNQFTFLDRLSKRGIPVILADTMTHGVVDGTFSGNVLNNVFEAKTMSVPVAQAKLRYAISAAGGDLDKLKNIMQTEYFGEIPEHRQLLRAKRPEVGYPGGRAAIPA